MSLHDLIRPTANTILTFAFLGLTALGDATVVIGAESETFPYEAVVQVDSTEVRSGPGATYYVTGHLKHGDPVTVHRHDRGGWFMISPPPGSFSYIRVEHVQSTDGRAGVVTLPDYSDGRPSLAVVRIGSSISDDAAFSGRQLSNGSKVHILGRKMVTTDGGQVEMFKISPPDREYRWVKGDFITKSGAPVKKARQERDDDLFDGALVAEFGAEDAPSIMTSGDGQAPAMTTRRPHNPSPDALLAQKKQLDEIDGRFRATVGQDPGSWRLDELEREYQTLKQGALTEILVGQIEQRLAAIKRRRDIVRQYEEFIKLTTETSDREQQLLALQNSAGAPAMTTEIETSLGKPGGLSAPEATPSQSSSNRSVSAMPTLDGAGLIQKQAPRFPGGPRYVLLATDGRTLAYLYSTSGINLEEQVGNERGVVGHRQFDNRLNGDTIDVRRLVPVRLKRQ